MKKKTTKKKNKTKKTTDDVVDETATFFEEPLSLTEVVETINVENLEPSTRFKQLFQVLEGSQERKFVVFSNM